jgi:cation:H+ antiporter
MSIFTIFVFVVSFVLLLWSGRMLPRAINGISKSVHISEFVTAFFLVAFATSIPELFVGISSAIQGVSGLSLGNVMGANFVNLTLVVGLSAIFAGSLSGDGRISSRNFWLIFLLSMLPVFLATDGIISRGDATILLGAFVLYILKIFRDGQYFHRELGEGLEDNLSLFSRVFKYLGQFIFGILLLLLSSFLLIWASKAMVQEYFKNGLLAFGVLYIAIGTALPELVFGIRSSLAGQPQAMFGNAIGSVAFNATAVIGLVALINPIKVDIDSQNFLVIAAFLFFAFTLFHLFVYTRHAMSRKEGIILVLLYIAFFSSMIVL